MLYLVMESVGGLFEAFPSSRRLILPHLHICRNRNIGLKKRKEQGDSNHLVTFLGTGQERPLRYGVLENMLLLGASECP